jgi:hypothetical protein
MPSIKTNFPFFWYADLVIVGAIMVPFLLWIYRVMRSKDKESLLNTMTIAVMIMTFVSFFFLF